MTTGNNTITEKPNDAMRGEDSTIVPASPSMLRSAAEFVAKHHCVIVLAYLLALELCVFGSSFAKTGFFLDDWLTLFQMKFGPSDFFALTQKYLFEDPRVLIRPLEAPYFAGLYKIFGFKAAPYHFANAAMEVLTAFFLYMTVLRLTRQKATAFIASALFVVNPTHDATHYWMVCSSATFSMMLFMSSFWSLLKAVDENKGWLYVTTGVLLTCSLFNYESCIALPLAMVVAVGVMLLPRLGLKSTILKCANVSFYLLIPVVVTVVYQRYLSPMIAFSWVKRIEADGSYMLPTITKGLEIQTPWALSAFIQKYLVADFFTGMNALSAILLISAMLGAALLAGIFMAQQKVDTIDQKSTSGWQLAGVGLLFAVLALAVFGLNSEYMPMMITIINRVNLGASIGASLITAATIVGCYELATSRSTHKSVAIAACCLIFTSITTVFALSDRALSHAWLASTAVQNRIREVMRSNASKLKPGDGIVIMNCPRYVMWAPIADGTWDLQAMLRVASNNNKIFATSVSDRLKVSEKGIRDIVLGKEVANIPFATMYSLEPHTAVFQRVPTAEAFIEAAQKTTMQMGINQSLITDWRASLAKSKAEFSSHATTWGSKDPRNPVTECP